jgi:hypothetical protein
MRSATTQYGKTLIRRPALRATLNLHLTSENKCLDQIGIDQSRSQNIGTIVMVGAYNANSDIFVPLRELECQMLLKQWECRSYKTGSWRAGMRNRQVDTLAHWYAPYNH